MCVHLSPRALIVTHMKCTNKNWLHLFYSCLVSFAIDIMNGLGLRKTAHCEHLLKKTIYVVLEGILMTPCW